jgi:hypothetical protein
MLEAIARSVKYGSREAADITATCLAHLIFLI